MSLTRMSRLQAPSFQLKVNGAPASHTLKDRLLAVSLVLNNGEISDHLTLSLDDRSTFLGKDIAVPDQGATLSVSLGYGRSLKKMGDYLVNELRLNGSGAGRTLSISATPALLSADKTRTWGNQTLGKIVADIAAEHQLTPKVSPSLQNKTLAVINQVNESNSAFLTRLAARYNAVFKPMAGNLLFMAKGEGSAASGVPMAPVNIFPHDILSWNKNQCDQEEYDKVCTYWYDYLHAAEQEVYVPSGQPTAADKVLRLPHLYNNQEEATAAARAKLSEVNREDSSLSLSLLGNADITAEGRIILRGLRNSVDGDYIVKQVSHSFSHGGFQSQLQAYAFTQE
ncbi:MAG: contractile injection system protein, VgrG/Pvc8 family [Pseudomonadota bacterium]